MANNVSKNNIVKLIIVFAVIIFGFAGWYWWQNIYMDSTNVFWGMINNNLSIASITKNTSQQSGSQTLDQYIQTQFGDQKASRNLTTFKQNGSTVKTETLGTLNTDYNRYLSIQTNQKTAKGKDINTSSVVGVWAKTDNSGNAAKAQYFKQSVFGGVVPFANLNPDARNQLVELIKSKNVYDISSGSIKSSKENGRSVYVYEVSIKPSAYVEVINELAKYLGLGNTGLDASQYAGAPAFKAEFSVDKVSRHLVKVSYPSTGQTETYNAHGIEQPIAEPKNAISMQSLQERLQKMLQ